MLSEKRRNEIRKGISKKCASSIEGFSKEELVQYIWDTQSIALAVSQTLISNI